MKNFLLALLALSILGLAACSKKEEVVIKPQPTPDAPRLKADSERLQQATANAAREREKASQSLTSSPTPSPSRP
jgi:hypothetical protein